LVLRWGLLAIGGLLNGCLGGRFFNATGFAIFNNIVRFLLRKEFFRLLF
jgi:hypothetical protein